MSISFSTAASLFSSSYGTADTTSSLLGILYGNGATQSAGNGTNPIVALQQAETNRTKSIAQEAKDPAVKRDVDTFRKAVASAKDLNSLLANPVARKVLLTANGLGDQTDFLALAQKALGADPADTKGLSNRLTDKRWLTTAKTYDFAKSGLTILQQPGVLDTIASGYAEVQWRKSLDVNTPGLSKALDFRDRASTITSSLQILGDATLRNVVTTALGLPQEIAVQSLDAQQKAIDSRVDVTRFKDPKFVETFVSRYLYQASQAAGPSAAQNNVTALFA